jgi:hypothetical protein
MRDPANSLFFYTADLHPENFRVGRPAFFSLSEHYFQDKSDNDMSVQRVLGSDPSAPNTRLLKKGQTTINKVLDFKH